MCSDRKKFTLPYFLIAAWGVLAISKKLTFLPLTLFLLNATYLIPVLTPIALLPVFAASFFLLVYMSGYQIEFIRMLLLDWRFTQMASIIHTQKRVQAFLKLYSKIFKIERISLAIAKHNSFEYNTMALL